jgi:hypothetical protein
MLDSSLVKAIQRSQRRDRVIYVASAVSAVLMAIFLLLLLSLAVRTFLQTNAPIY